MISRKNERFGEEQFNNQGCLMKIIKYNNSKDVVIEFQDEYKSIVHATYQAFISGTVKNPYYPSVCNIGIIGNKYPASINKKLLKENIAWRSMIERCFDKKIKDDYPTYNNVTCCEEWLLYENFYEWIHLQSNYEKWLNGDCWAIDKDIIAKGNKIYSPEMCSLVPKNVNGLFVKKDQCRGGLPIGVRKHGKHFRATYSCNGKNVNIGTFFTPEEAFFAYKTYKENYIKQVAQEEFDKGNITQKCYEAMMRYEVEITD